MRRVAVIGAGYAGVAAAVALTRAGVAVTLLDASRTVGGRARRVTYRGVTLDNGQHLLLGAYRETLALMRDVNAPASGLSRRRLDLHYPGLLRLSAPRLPAPLHLLAALMTARGLSVRERLAAARLAFTLRAAEAAAAPGETVSAFLDRQRQPLRLRHLLWEPLCVAALNTPPSCADARVFARVMGDSLLGSREDSDFLLPTADLSALLPEPAVAWLGEHGATVTLGQRITGLREHGPRWEVVAGGSGRADFDAVVCATAAAECAAIVGTVAPLAPLAKRLTSIPHEPITTVYLQYPVPVKLPAPMVAIEGGFAQWLFDRQAIAGANGLVAAVVSASQALGEDAHDIAATLAHRDVARLVSSLPPPSWAKVIREKRATFACVPGVFRPPPRTDARGVVLAGDYTEGPYPATIEGAVRSGQRAARILLGREASGP